MQTMCKHDLGVFAGLEMAMLLKKEISLKGNWCAAPFADDSAFNKHLSCKKHTNLQSNTQAHLQDIPES